MKTMREAESPVTFRINVARLPKNGMPVSLDASDQQRAQLAREHGLLSVGSFRAEMLVEPWKGRGVRVSGRLAAQIVQECVVTLDPLESRIDEPIEAVFVPEDSRLGREGFETGGEILLDAEGDDSPELFSGDTIDVGALAEQFFGLAIDPYPRKAGAELESSGGAEPKDVADWQQKLGAFTRKP